MIAAVVMIVLIAIVAPLALWAEQSQRLRMIEARLARLERGAAPSAIAAGDRRARRRPRPFGGFMSELARLV